VNDFLVNLARRSLGRANVPKARSMPLTTPIRRPPASTHPAGLSGRAAPLTAGSSQATPSRETPGTNAAHSVERASRVASPSPVDTVSRPAIALQPMAADPAERPSESTAGPESGTSPVHNMPSLPAPRSPAPLAQRPPAWPTILETGGDESVRSGHTAHLAASPAPRRAANPPLRPMAVVPAASAVAAQPPASAHHTADAQPHLAASDIVSGVGVIGELHVRREAGPAPRPPAPSTPLAMTHDSRPPPPAQAAPGHGSLASPRRNVQVSIGTIEVHATEPLPAPVPAPSPASAPGTPAPASGFDDFVRLRTYVPWER
jgi:hypothetical protein